MNKRRIKVLVVDDSMLFRETIAKGLREDPVFEVVGTASDPFDARDKIEQLDPDVLSLDVEMPKMNGIEFTRRLMPQHPIPIVVVSAVSANVFDAMAAGAVDFVTKPGIGSENGIERLIRELSIKLKIAASARLKTSQETTRPRSASTSQIRGACRLIAVGASTGGTEAVATLLKALPADIPPVVVVQHMPPVFTKLFAERLDQTCPQQVVEAQDGQPVQPGTVYIAPGGLHMTVIRKHGQLTISCLEGDKVSGHCPSVNVLFDSILELGQVAAGTIGILLTGMGKDGAEGLLNLKRGNALTICQDEATSVVFGMPAQAIRLGAACEVLPIGRIHEPILASIRE